MSKHRLVETLTAAEVAYRLPHGARVDPESGDIHFAGGFIRPLDDGRWQVWTETDAALSKGEDHENEH